MISKIFNLIFVKIAYAGTVNLGTVTGVGPFQTAAASSGSGLERLISLIVGALTAISGIAFLIYFVLGGLSWITAGGKQDAVQKAQKQMTDAAIGLIVVVVSYFIVGIIGFILGFDILDPVSILF